MSNKKVKSAFNKQDQETSFRKLSTKYAETAAVEDNRVGGLAKYNNSSQFSFKNEKKVNMADSGQPTVRKENRIIKRTYESKQDERVRRNKGEDGRIPVGVKQYTRQKKTQNSSEQGSNASLESNKRQKAVLLSIKKPKHLKSIDSVTHNQQKTQLKPVTIIKEAAKTNKLLFYKSEETKSSPKDSNSRQTQKLLQQKQKNEKVGSNNEFMVNYKSDQHHNAYQPQYLYKKNVHEKGEDKLFRLKNKLGFIIDMANRDQAASVSYYSQSSVDSKNSQIKRSRTINQPIKTNNNISLSVQRQRPQSIIQPKPRKTDFTQQKQEKSSKNRLTNDNQHENKKLKKLQKQTFKKKQTNIKQDIRQKESQQDIREQMIQRKPIVMYKKTNSNYQKIKVKQKHQDQQEQQQKERQKYKDKQQRKDNNRQQQQNRLKSRPKQQQRQKQRTKLRQRQKLVKIQREKQKKSQRQKPRQNQRQRQRQKQRQRQIQGEKQKQAQRQGHIQREKQTEKEKEALRQTQRQKQRQKQTQKQKRKQRPQQKPKQNVKQKPKQQKYELKPKNIQKTDIKKDDYETVKNQQESYLQNANSNSNFQIKLQKVLIDDLIKKPQPNRYVAQQKQDNKVSKRLNFDRQDTAQFQQSSRAANNLNTDSESSKLSQKQDDYLDEEIAELMKKNDEYLGLAKKQIGQNKFDTDMNYLKNHQKGSRPNMRKIIHIQPRRRLKTQLDQRQVNNSRMLTDRQKTFLRLLKSKQEQLLNKIKSEKGNNPKPFFGESYEFQQKHISTQFGRKDDGFEDGRDRKPNKINPTTKTYEVSKILPVLSVASTKPKKQIGSSYLAFSPYLMREKESEYSTNLSRDQTSKSIRSPNYSIKINNNEPAIGRYNEKNYDSSDREYRTQNISEKYQRLKRLMRRIQ